MSKEKQNFLLFQLKPFKKLEGFLAIKKLKTLAVHHQEVSESRNLTPV